MEENNVQSTLEPTEPRSPEQKPYHSPELTVYGDVRELTMTNPLATGPDNFIEASLRG